MTRIFSVSAIAAASMFIAPTVGMAQSARMNIEVDQTQRIQLRGPAGSVIVGNPQIADVTVVDANTLFVVGKGYGVTEVVAVDPVGRTLFQSQVVVTAGSGSSAVRVWRGGQVTEMACGLSCSPTGRSAGAAPVAPTP